MRRGDLVTAAVAGDFGKPRPALVIQADVFAEHPTVTVLPLTGNLLELRLTRVQVEPDSENGLEKPSHVMIDKATTIKREKLGAPFGRLDAITLAKVDKTLGTFLGITS
ncbi:type II toxin-antitoxin system PemK/MazF family toxin [Pistricoccus aurantiacus]|uniref:type II toxin-antitoxin system PemK/MazF family toxin n=1 Tax=Pistricoccus aurantiacus TaxID=1883414 RepID=UPI003639813B